MDNIDYINTIKTEQDNNINEDLNDFGEKFGEVYINKGKISYYCIQCPEESFKEIINFENHLREIHITNSVLIDHDDPDEEIEFKDAGLKIETISNCDNNDFCNLQSENHQEDDVLDTIDTIPVNKKTRGRKKIRAEQILKPRIRREKRPNIISPDPIFVTGPDGNQIQRFPCSHCEKNYSAKKKQREHIAFHLGTNPLYKCEVCGACLKSSSTLKSHMRIHTGERPYKCNLCPKTFSAKPGLLNHLVVHAGDRKFECTVCGKHFKSKYHLQLHERIHSGEKPYQCDTCGKNFTSSSRLTEHNKRHLNLRPFKCDVCQKSFYTKQQMLSHKISHTNEKNFICKVCSATFGRRINLRQHERTHSGSKDYKCKICAESFFRYSAIYYHMKSQHSSTRMEYSYVSSTKTEEKS